MLANVMFYIGTVHHQQDTAEDITCSGVELNTPVIVPACSWTHRLFESMLPGLVAEDPCKAKSFAERRSGSEEGIIHPNASQSPIFKCCHERNGKGVPLIVGVRANETDVSHLLPSVLVRKGLFFQATVT